jgi:RNA polymerase sigma factor (sigma-70 family)
MHDDPLVVTLVVRAAGSDQAAWDEIVERYAPLVWSICSRYRLSGPDIEDVGQSVWLRLVERIGDLREPAALPGWLATTTRRECLRVLRKQDRYMPLPDEFSLGPDDLIIEEEIIAAERNIALRAALAELPAACRDVLLMLISDPPCSYAEISSTLQVRIGSIGSLRGRCLERLRRSKHLIAVLDDETTETGGSTSGGELHV